MRNNESTLDASDTLQGSGRRALKTIVMAGLVAGALDITYAFIIWGLRGVSPIRIGQSVASGLIGREAAVGGGTATGMLGLLLHFLMAIIIAAIYYAAARNIRLLVDRAVPCGIAYGLVTVRRDELRRHAALGDRQHGRRRYRRTSRSPASSCTCSWSACRSR